MATHQDGITVVAELEAVLLFLAFGADVERFQTPLRSMFGLSGDGLHDRMLRFTKPITGSFLLRAARGGHQVGLRGLGKCRER